MYGRLRHARGDSRPARRSRRAGQRRWPAAALAAPVIALGAPAAATAVPVSSAPGTVAAAPAPRRRGTGRGGRARDRLAGGRRRRPRAGPAARLDHGVRGQLQRPGAQQALDRQVALRRRPRVELRHRRDRDHDRLDQERVPHRRRAPASDRPGQRRFVDLGPDPDEHGERGRAARRQTGGDRLDPPAVPSRRARLLAGLLDARTRPVAGERRDRHHGGRQRPVRAVRHHPLRYLPGRPVQRAERRRQRAAALPRLPGRLPHATR